MPEAYRFVPMNSAYAREIIAHWQYPPPYDIYNYDKEADWIGDERAWGDELWAVLNEAGELVGELSIHFLAHDDDEAPIDREPGTPAPPGAVLWLGFGLRPDLTGRGLGMGFVSACVDFGVAHFRYEGDHVGLGVYEFNERARKVYERVGFRPVRWLQAGEGGRKLAAVWMHKKLGGTSRA